MLPELFENVVVSVQNALKLSSKLNACFGTFHAIIVTSFVNFNAPLLQLLESIYMVLEHVDKAVHCDICDNQKNSKKGLQLQKQDHDINI